MTRKVIQEAPKKRGWQADELAGIVTAYLENPKSDGSIEEICKHVKNEIGAKGLDIVTSPRALEIMLTAKKRGLCYACGSGGELQFNLKNSYLDEILALVYVKIDEYKKNGVISKLRNNVLPIRPSIGSAPIKKRA